MLQTEERRGDVPALDLRRRVGVEAERVVLGEHVAGLAAAHDALPREARDVHDTGNRGAVEPARRVAAEGHRTSAAYRAARHCQCI